MRKIGVYKITCSGDGKIYIGSSNDVRQRITTHFRDLLKQKHNNSYLQNAYNLYGKDSLSFEIIEICDISVLRQREQFWIDKTECYNRNIGFNNCKGSNGPIGYQHTEEAKRKISLKNKGNKCSEETKIKIRLAALGRKHSEESKKKMSLGRMGNKNPCFGSNEDPTSRAKRMTGVLATPAWNKGLTKNTDSRIKSTNGYDKKCRLTNVETGEKWEANSLTELASIGPFKIMTLYKLRKGIAGQETMKKFKIEIL